MEHTHDKLKINSYLNGLKCPQCGTHKISKNGKTKTNTCYVCRECRKSFSSTTGSVIHGIHKREQFLQYARCIDERMTIRQAAKLVGISVATSFAWRHKYLVATKDILNTQFSKAITCGIEQIPYSAKGSRQKISPQPKSSRSLVVADLHGRIHIQKINNTKEIHSVLQSRVQSSSQIVSEKQALLTNTLKHVDAMPVQNRSLLKSELDQKMETFKQHLKQWMDKYRGVSTKYLQHYWNWYSCEQNIFHSSEANIAEVYADKSALQRYRAIATA